MKKLLCVLAVLLLLIPAAHGEDLADDEKAFVGVWVRYHEYKDSGVIFELFQLTADHQVYYLNQTFKPGEVGYGRQAAKTWQKIRDNRILITYGENAKSEAFITDSGELGIYSADNSYYYSYTKIPGGKDQQTSVYIPAGDWTVGVDIPAGEYSVTLANKNNSTNFVVWRGAKNDTSYGFNNLVYNLILSRTNSTLGKITLEDGNTLVISAAIILDKPAVIKFPQ